MKRSKSTKAEDASIRELLSIKAMQDEQEQYFKDIDAYAVMPDRPVVDVEFPCVVVFADDEHSPYADLTLQQTISDRAHELAATVGAKRVFKVGFEMGDYAGLSTFLPDSDSKLMREELQLCELLKWQVAHYDCVMLGQSNHMDRPHKFLARLCRTHDQAAFLGNLGTPLPLLLKSEPRIIYRHSPVLQVGNAAFGHFDKYMFKAGEMVRHVHDHLGANGHWRGTTWPLAMVACGHAHHPFMGVAVGYPTMLFEAPCAGLIQPYVTKDTKIKGYGRKSWMTGCVLSVFDKRGSLVRDRTHMVMVGLAQLPEYVRSRNTPRR